MMSDNTASPTSNPLVYENFELEILPGKGKNYAVSVLHSPCGEAHSTMVLPFEKRALELLLQKLQNALLLSSGAYRLVPSSETQVVQDFGHSLFEALLTGDVRTSYDVSCNKAMQEGKGLRLVLRITPSELAVLPWEFLYDQRTREFIGLSRSKPIVRYVETPQSVQPLTVKPPLHILGMIASPSGLPSLDIDDEKRRMEEAIKDLQDRGLVSLTWIKGQTWRDLQNALRDGTWHIFHFIGHGGFDPTSDEGLIELADENQRPYPLHATELSNLLADHHSLRLVLLNSCEGGRGSENDILSSMASVLVLRGIPAVLAMQFSITNQAATEFSRSFYETLAKFWPVDAAVAEARKAVSLAVPRSAEWGIPVLYMRASQGVIFERSAQDSLAEQEAERNRLAAEEARRKLLASQQAERDRLAAEEAEREQQAAEETARQEAERARRQQGRQKVWGWGKWALLALVGVIILAWLGPKLFSPPPATPIPATQESTAAAIVELTPTLTYTFTPATISSPTPTLIPSPTLTPIPPLGIGSTRVSSKDSMVQVYVPAGQFWMGSDKSKDPNAEDKELPQHLVDLDAYWIDQTEVTNAMYVHCEVDGLCAPTYSSGSQTRSSYLGNQHFDNVPVIFVTWDDAQAYCDWAGRRLPSEAEWEKAARGTDGRIYPWAGALDCSNANYAGCTGDTTAVGSYPAGASPYGALDMAGNVWEWVADWYSAAYYQNSSGYNPEGPSSGAARVTRGGSWFFDSILARSAARRQGPPSYAGVDLGFRCASSQ